MHFVQQSVNRAVEKLRFLTAGHLEYMLMTNHVHLLLSSSSSNGVSALMKAALGQRYVQYVNHTYRRSGTLWKGRFRSCLTQEESYPLACQHYIELNPVRAGMVVPHPLYLALGADAASRQEAYRRIVPL